MDFVAWCRSINQSAHDTSIVVLMYGNAWSNFHLGTIMSGGILQRESLPKTKGLPAVRFFQRENSPLNQ